MFVRFFIDFSLIFHFLETFSKTDVFSEREKIKKKWGSDKKKIEKTPN